MPETLEVEVIEIDGAPPPVAPPPPKQEPPQKRFSFGGIPDWRTLGAKLLKLDRRWWPLWVIIGLAALSLLVVVALFVASAVIVGAILRAVFRSFISGGNPPAGNYYDVTRRS